MKSIALALLLAGTAFADVKVSNRATTAGQSFNSTVLIKAGKIRSESSGTPGLTIVTIQDCSTHRLIQINDRTRSFMSMEIPVNGQEQTTSGAATNTGGVTLEVNEEDTGERKTYFGYTARHIKGTITAEGNASCSTNMHATTDGWYIDIPEAQGCPTEHHMLLALQESGCGGGVRTKISGVERSGYPVVLDTTVESRGTPVTTHQETTELSTATLDPTLFEVPAGYTKVNSYQALMGLAAPENSKVGMSGQPPDQMFPQTPNNGGATAATDSGQANAGHATGEKKKLRIGVAQVTSIVSQSLATDGWQQELVNDINFLGAEGVVLSGDPNDREATLEEAKERKCDYVVLTTVTTFKSVSVGEKIGSVLGHGGLGGVGGSGQGRVEIGAEVKVFQPDSAVPIFDGNDDFRQNDPDGTAKGLLHTEAREVMLRLRKLQSAK